MVHCSSAMWSVTHMHLVSSRCIVWRKGVWAHSVWPWHIKVCMRWERSQFVTCGCAESVICERFWMPAWPLRTLTSFSAWVTLSRLVHFFHSVAHSRTPSHPLVHSTSNGVSVHTGSSASGGLLWWWHKVILILVIIPFLQLFDFLIFSLHCFSFSVAMHHALVESLMGGGDYRLQPTCYGFKPNCCFAWFRSRSIYWHDPAQISHFDFEQVTLLELQFYSTLLGHDGMPWSSNEKKACSGYGMMIWLCLSVELSVINTQALDSIFCLTQTAEEV